MKKYITVPKLIEITEFNLDAFSQGFELLALNKQLNPEVLTPTELISGNRIGSDKEPYEWLQEVLDHIVTPNLELLGQNVICSSTAFFDLLETVDEPYNEILQSSILSELKENFFSTSDSFDNVDSLDSINPLILDAYFRDNYLKVTTIASPLFDKNFDFMTDLDFALPYIVAPHLDLECDLFEMTYINSDNSTAYHKSSKYQHSISILSYTSNAGEPFDFYTDAYESSGKLSYVDSVIEAYQNLLAK